MGRHELITIATFSYPVQAHILKTRLESEGIPAIIVDERMSTLYFVYPKEVRVQGRESDAEAAVQILDSIPKELPEDNYESERCPECNSLDTRYYIFNL